VYERKSIPVSANKSKINLHKETIYNFHQELLAKTDEDKEGGQKGPPSTYCPVKVGL
jgi:hypothetical protein